MRLNKSILCVLVLTGLLLVPAISQEQKVAGSRINAFFNGLNEFNIFIIPDYPESLANKRFNDLLNEVTASISAKLEKSGFRVLKAGQIYVPYQQQSVPQYKVSIGMYQLSTGDYLFRVQTTVAATVLLYGQMQEVVMYDAWMTAGTVEVMADVDANPFVVDMVMSQADSFIAAYNKVNGTIMRAETAKPKSDKSASSASSAADSNSEPNAASVNMQYEYVASKNSTIFHKTDCSITKRILEQNLVKYATREDAMKDGKKPCRQCKP